ncbi:MAG: hypothetical protein FJZ59_05280 [Chlamydiae bacterium]|nr:hypothetical protein [Chlamydiota bacterium]
MQAISKTFFIKDTDKPNFATEKNWKNIRISSFTLPIIHGLAIGYERSKKTFSSKCSCAIQMSGCAVLALPEAATRIVVGAITSPSMVIAPDSVLSSISVVSLATGFENIAISLAALVAATRRLSTDGKIDIAKIANSVSFGWIDLSEED